MALGSLAGVIPRLRNTALAAQRTASDAELLDRFVTTRDALAFEALVRRHGPMVFAVCHRVLHHTHDAEDAFQATFLVLAYKAASVAPRSKLAGWLHGVAQKTALKARHRAARRAEIEKRVPARSAEEMPPDTARTDAEAQLDQELAGLPDRYRLPIILCDLEGRLRSEVAVTLECSEGTLSSRLTRGRRMLAERLQRRGVYLGAGALALILTERSSALAEPLIRATVPVALVPIAATTVSPNVVNLATGVMKNMFLKKLQAVAVAAFVTVAATFALTGLVADPTQAAPVPKTPAGPGLDEKALNEALADVDGRLLLNRKVLKDIKCDIDQLDRIMDTLEAAQQKAQLKSNEAMAQIRLNPGANLTAEAINQMFKDAHETGEKEFRKSVADVVAKQLAVAQRQRLWQIDVQTRGHEAFTTPSVAKALELTPKQKEQFAANIKQTEDEAAQAFQKPFQGNVVIQGVGGGVIQGGVTATFDSNKVIKEMREEGMKRALAILTDEQNAVWKKLVGAPFTHPVNRPWGPTSGNVRLGGFQAVPAPGVMIAPGRAIAVPALPAVPLLPAAPALPVVPPPAPGK